jgi:hypothetical protein
LFQRFPYINRDANVGSPQARRVRFPWMTFGYNVDFAWNLAYGHLRPWENLEDALNVLQSLPYMFHNNNQGFFCPGPAAKILNMSPADAFFATVNRINEKDFNVFDCISNNLPWWPNGVSLSPVDWKGLSRGLACYAANVYRSTGLGST